MSNQLVLGSYVKFKNQPYIAISYDGRKVKIMDVFSNRKLVVLRSNIAVSPYVAKKVEFQGSQYLVTLKNYIISCKTNKVMQWCESDNNRKGILALAQGV